MHKIKTSLVEVPKDDRILRTVFGTLDSIFSTEEYKEMNKACKEERFAWIESDETQTFIFFTMEDGLLPTVKMLPANDGEIAIVCPSLVIIRKCGTGITSVEYATDYGLISLECLEIDGNVSFGQKMLFPWIVGAKYIEENRKYGRNLYGNEGDTKEIALILKDFQSTIENNGLEQQDAYARKLTRALRRLATI